MNTQPLKLCLLTLFLAVNVHATTSQIVGEPVTHISPRSARVTAQPVAAPQPTFQLTPPETIRQALERWASQASWTFGPDFYALPVDIPVATSANLGTDFKQAVRMLLESTAMGETPAQPCFYSNNVLRVVPQQQLCARP